ncbi:BQ2448_7371 [Microbotryum intermedium]|uniref:Decapping nuclease n=1 Tax=Microbotryum intermedium TaxID=269621 RepID=A0A238FJW9_9BASI|nr:BQ2448_7371 [Microbotryum intermedium]
MLPSPSPTRPSTPLDDGQEQRPLKRRRANSYDKPPPPPPPPASVPVTTTSSTTSTATSTITSSPPNTPYHHPIQPPLDPHNAPPCRPIAFQQPLHLTSFSYSPTRRVLLTPHDRDASLAVYSSPSLGSDLNTGFEQAVWRDDRCDEGLDALLDTLQHYVEADTTGAAAEMLDKVNIITWRGMITKLLLAVYQVQEAHTDATHSKRTRAEGWEMNVMLMAGTLYFEESKTPSHLSSKAASEKSYLRQSYYGYSFEAFSTRSPQSQSHPSHTKIPFAPPNTNVQWCSIVKTNLGGFRMFLGGEVDCLRAGWREGDPIRTDDFVELKTNIVIGSHRDETLFERQKLLKHYTQSFLLGVPTIIVGFRTRAGHLTALQSFKTLEIPRLVRHKPHAWSPTTSLASAFDLIQFINTTLLYDEHNKAAEDRWKETGEIPENGWPVWRLKFRPLEEREREGGVGGGGGGRGGLELVRLTEGEVEDEVKAGKKRVERVGFLLNTWVEGLRERRRRKG